MLLNVLVVSLLHRVEARRHLFSFKLLLYLLIYYTIVDWLLKMFLSDWSQCSLLGDQRSDWAVLQQEPAWGHGVLHGQVYLQTGLFRYWSIKKIKIMTEAKHTIYAFKKPWNRSHNSIKTFLKVTFVFFSEAPVDLMIVHFLSSYATDKCNNRKTAANQTFPALSNWLQVRFNDYSVTYNQIRDARQKVQMWGKADTLLVD